MSRVWQHMGSEQTRAMTEIRALGRQWRRRFIHNPTRMLAASQWHRQLSLTLDDFEHLLVDSGRDGWLNGEIIETALRLYAADAAETTQVMNPHAWATWVQNGYQACNTPDLWTQAQEIQIPVHLGGDHWALAVLDRRHRQMVWLDSLEGFAMAREAAFVMLRKFIGEFPELRGGGLWTQTTTRSVQQHNTFDCGIFVTQNARARALGKDRAGTFNGYEARSALARELLELANKANPPVPPPLDAGTAGQPICVEERSPPICSPPPPPPSPPAPPTTPRHQGRSIGRRHVIGFEYTTPTTRRMSSRPME
jgi:hypothetical protein